MAFLKRLGYYMIGLTIGIIFLAFFLKKKTSETGTEFCYFPNCRVLKELRSKPLVFSEEMQATLRDGIADSTALKLFLREGSVKFSESEAQGKPCPWYVIYYEVDGKDASLRATNCESQVTLSEFSFTED
ncbi:hypothetical protein SAMN06265375_104202 [Muriicola jejuensis]|uniref:DUF4258 domain-containing protein n=1 Tax=Muriicola jejuensis TaxID=504488 RepID=A0A6P0UF15_9FLAO|nr:DUF4258 domain-containing protein [Muriicola jejuensis]NER11212.1 DUF4258 domain-containing protein [Muriicola jejuensis]SMP24272.1 hypothetical protein SAMN06265375_104202 [Muriicola jejuensis]